MKKRLLTLTLVMAIMCSLAACGTAPAPSGTSSTPTPPSNSAGGSSQNSGSLPKINDLELLSGSATGSWYTIGAGVADKFNDLYDGFPMTCAPGPGSIGDVPVIAAGESDIGMSYGPFLIAAVNGNAPYETAYTNLRSIAALQPTVIQPLTTLDIKTFGDFVNNKVKGTLGLYPVGNASTHIISMILKEYGIENADDISSWGASTYYADGASIADAWSDRHIDIQFPMLNVPASTVTEALVTRTDGKLFSLDEDIVSSLEEKYGFSAYTIKAGSYEGQDEDILTIGLPIVFFCTEDTDEDIVYNFTKSLHENKEYFLGVHSSFGEFSPETMHEGCAIDLHPGAVKYYQEIGLM